MGSLFPILNLTQFQITWREKTATISRLLKSTGEEIGQLAKPTRPTYAV